MRSLLLAIALCVHGYAAAAEPAKAAPAKPAAEKAPAAKGNAETAQPPKSETAKADENRRKPLQRCDQVADKAQVECLKKARERIVEARSKREAAGENDPKSKAKGVESAKSSSAPAAKSDSPAPAAK